MGEPLRWEAVGLSEPEYRSICAAMGREPNDVELGMFGAMWSEHCSYKSSRAFLGQLPSRGPAVVMGPGENAGVVEIGDGYAIALRIESHNHPSAVEPLEGAATGVGGILRDIFAVGARPFALLDGLCFGPLADRHSRHIASGVVEGIAHYGNAVGVPTVGGQTVFDPAYGQNPLVNVCCLGTARTEELQRGAASGVGNDVWLIGNRTGRDGIHGASLLASRTFTERPEDMRPSVQVSDPFVGKLLMEATLELAAAGVLRGLNDLGAAGITSAVSEAAGRGGVGIELDLDAVPCREEGMLPYEIMISESQERMLLVADGASAARIQEVCARLGISSARIGRVIAERCVRVRSAGGVVAEVPVAALTDGAPRYRRKAVRAVASDPWTPPDAGSAMTPVEVRQTLLRLLSSPGIASPRWIYRQYDHQVQTNTVLGPGAADAAVLRHRATGKGIAVALDFGGGASVLDPYRGAALLVAEGARNVACVGARPSALVDCLNFASPEDPQVMGGFIRTIRGMAAACRALGVPVVGGNVSFYNGTVGLSEGIPPTPAIAMLGILEDAARARPSGPSRAGEVCVLLGPLFGARLEGSAYQFQRWGVRAGRPARLDGRREQALLQVLATAECSAAHDCSDGGLAVACAEMVLTSPAGIGLEVDLPSPRGKGPMARTDALLFGEGPGRVVATVSPDALPALRDLCEATGVACRRIGWTVPGGGLVLRIGGRVMVAVTRQELDVWEEALPRWF